MKAYPRKYMNTNKACRYQSFQKHSKSLGKEPFSKSSIQVVTNPGMITIFIRPTISFVTREEKSVSFLESTPCFLCIYEPKLEILCQNHFLSKICHFYALDDTCQKWAAVTLNNNTNRTKTNIASLDS